MKVTLQNGFTLAEALVMLLVCSLMIVATMPVITKKVRHRLDYKFGPPGGWVCKKEKMPCRFRPPAKSKNFAIYFDDNTVPSFSVTNMGELNIISAKERIVDVNRICSPPTEEEKLNPGLGEHDSSWDEYKEHHTIQEEDEWVTLLRDNCETIETVIQEGGCGNVPELYKAFEEYTRNNVKLKGTFCTGKKQVRIVY